MHVFLTITIILSAQTPGRGISSVPENALHSDGSNKSKSTDLEDAVVPKEAAMESLPQHTRVCDMPEDVGAGQDMHMGGLAHATRPVKLVGGQVKGGCGVTMIGSFHDSHMPRSWPVCSCYTQC